MSDKLLSLAADLAQHYYGSRSRLELREACTRTVTGKRWLTAVVMGGRDVHQSWGNTPGESVESLLRGILPGLTSQHEEVSSLVRQARAAGIVEA